MKLREKGEGDGSERYVYVYRDFYFLKKKCIVFYIWNKMRERD